MKKAWLSFFSGEAWVANPLMLSPAMGCLLISSFPDDRYRRGELYGLGIGRNELGSLHWLGQLYRSLGE